MQIEFSFAFYYIIWMDIDILLSILMDRSGYFTFFYCEAVARSSLCACGCGGEWMKFFLFQSSILLSILMDILGKGQHGEGASTVLSCVDLSRCDSKN